MLESLVLELIELSEWVCGLRVKFKMKKIIIVCGIGILEGID